MTRKSIKKNRRKARGWMAEHGVRPVDIQRSLGHKSATQAIETMKGIRNDRRVLQYLLDQGCPARYLALPNDILERLKAAS